MEDKIKELENSYTILNNVCAGFRGTRQEHEQLLGALGAVKKLIDEKIKESNAQEDKETFED